MRTSLHVAAPLSQYTFAAQPRLSSQLSTFFRQALRVDVAAVLHVENSKGQTLVQIATERDKPIALQLLTEELLKVAERAQALLDKRP